MRPVSIKRRLPAENANHEHTQGVVHRDDQNRHGQNRCGGLPVDHLLVLPEESKVDERESLYSEKEADQQGTRIPHEYSGRGYVVPQKAQNCCYQYKGEHRQGQISCIEEPGPKKDRSYRSNASRQSIDSVNEVIGIDENDNGENRQQKPDSIGDLIDPEQTTQ